MSPYLGYHCRILRYVGIRGSELFDGKLPVDSFSDTTYSSRLPRDGFFMRTDFIGFTLLFANLKSFPPVFPSKQIIVVIIIFCPPLLTKNTPIVQTFSPETHRDNRPKECSFLVFFVCFSCELSLDFVRNINK